MRQEMQKKVDRAIRLIRSAGRDGMVVEIAYSGGKDSDVILELARMSGIKYRAIYKNTTIDPPGTIKHAKENGAEILQPKHTFFELMAKNGAPSRFMRFCCKYLKEYKVLDRVIIGVRREESIKRAARYKEPTECKIYSKTEKVEAFYPILDWSSADIVEFVTERNLRLHPIYYREDGTIDPSRRVGCMCCPMAYLRKRQREFLKYPKMAEAYIRALQKFRDTHPSSKNIKLYDDVYEWFVRDLFFDKQKEFESFRSGLFGKPDYRKILDDFFGRHIKI